MIKHWMTAVIAAVTLLAGSFPALAATEQEQRVANATTVIRQFVDIPENAIPPALLGKAYGIAVIPSVLKIGFVFGGRRGSGVLSVRTADGSWSNPAFITLTGGSIGWQIGASSTDIILVFKTQRSIDKIADGQFSLGADAAVAAGPVGRSAGASTDLGLNAEVYSYARSRGLFAGVSVEGARLGVDRDANWLFYDKAGLHALTILKSSDESRMPKAGQRFVYTLDRYMPAADDFDRRAATGGSSMQSSAQGNASNAGRGRARPLDDDNNITVRQGNYDPQDNDGGAGNAAQGNGGGYGQADASRAGSGGAHSRGQSSGGSGDRSSGNGGTGNDNY